MAVKMAQSEANPAKELRWSEFLSGIDAEAKASSRRRTKATK
jgi:hypothetical protein